MSNPREQVRAISVVVYDPSGRERPGTTYPPGSVWMADKPLLSPSRVDATPQPRKRRTSRLCAVCTKEFLAKRSDAVYCSNRCRIRGNRSGRLFRDGNDIIN
jgi:hypothetical protein